MTKASSPPRQAKSSRLTISPLPGRIEAAPRSFVIPSVAQEPAVRLRHRYSRVEHKREGHEFIAHDVSRAGSSLLINLSFRAQPDPERSERDGGVEEPAVSPGHHFCHLERDREGRAGRFVSGHDFSRAVKQAKTQAASAAEAGFRETLKAAVGSPTYRNEGRRETRMPMRDKSQEVREG
jgi:hypothetical protein